MLFYVRFSSFFGLPSGLLPYSQHYCLYQPEALVYNITPSYDISSKDGETTYPDFSLEK